MKKIIFEFKKDLETFLKLMRDVSIARGYLAPSRLFAYLSGKRLKSEDYRHIAAINVRDSWLEVASKAADMSGQGLTVDEYNFMLKKSDSRRLGILGR